MNPRLVALTGPLTGQTIAIVGDEFTLGRHSSNHLAVREIAVSRRHAEITRTGETFTLRDLGSRHGSTVNGERVETRDLAHGDNLGFGDSRFLFLLQDSVVDSDSLNLDDSTFLGSSAFTLELSESLYSRPERILDSRLAESRLGKDLSVLLRAGSSLATIRSLEELAGQFLDLVLEAVGAERGALLLAVAGEDRFDPVFVRDRSGAAKEPVVISQTVTLRVMRQQLALLSNDVRQADDLGDAASLEAARVGSVLCVPLLTPGTGRQQAEGPSHRCLGVVYLDARREGLTFDEADLRLLTAVAGMAATAMANLRHLAWVDGERQRLQAEKLDHDMVGESETMSRALELIARVARTDTTVLLRGESGTGKELAAQAIHRGGERRDRPFVAINCATLSESLLESELFGHEKGAFTGAAVRKTGKLEVADTGTLFLDEVGELPLTTQAKLLRVLQEREFERVGGTRPIRIDVRVLAATNRDLEAAITDGGFREDLFYRLNVIAITLPPLRERRSDILTLAQHFAGLHSRRLKRPLPDLSPQARRCLQRYSWPGNIRELSNAIERALVLSPGDVIHPEDLPDALLEAPGRERSPGSGYHEELRETKKQLIIAAVRDAAGNITQAAQALQLHPNYLHRLITNLELRSELL